MNTTNKKLQNKNQEEIQDNILYTLVKENNLEKIKKLFLDTSIIISSKDKRKSFMHAISKNYNAISIYFIENSHKGFDIHTFDDYPFRISAENGNLEMVHFLFNKGVNIFNSDNHALKYSVYNNHPDVIEFLVDKGADIYAYSPVPVIAIAIKEKHYESLQTLLNFYISDNKNFFDENFLIKNINYDTDIQLYIEQYIQAKILNNQLENTLVDNSTKQKHIEKKSKI